MKTLGLVESAIAVLREGKPARLADVATEDSRLFKQLDLLTSKPVLYVCNVDEANAAQGNAHSARVIERATADGIEAIVISAKIEAEVAQLEASERDEYLADLGLSEPGLNLLVRAGYKLLGLITYFTAGPKEARAWTVPEGTSAPRAAGIIHSDFERGFIRAETISYDDYIGCGGENGARDAGKMRLEGKEYLVRDGDVLLIRAAT